MRIMTGRASKASFALLKTNTGHHVLGLSGCSAGPSESSAMGFDKDDPVVLKAFSWTKIQRGSSGPKYPGLAPEVTLGTNRFASVHVEPIRIYDRILPGGI